MKTAAKMSRNQQRKKLYADLADKGSRNQDAIESPLFGHFEVVTGEPIVKVIDDDESWTGSRTVVVGERKVIPYQRIVHDGPMKRDGSAKMAKRTTNARKIARQRRAWARCKGHDFNDGRINCRSCGCPREAVSAL